MSGSGPFRVENWSIETLGSLFIEFSGSSSDALRDKDHLDYFEEYFTELHCSTILVEQPYIDHDYLEDYAVYYAKCFHPYERYCARLHFFSSGFDQQALSSLLQGEASSVSPHDLDGSYLGFIVVKPLPGTFIGRTCLRTYQLEDKRVYPTTHTYDVHLFGLGLTVDSVAFQEQDSTVAMCATSALWSAFHVTGRLFHHPILSPVEITTAATQNSDDPMRSLPNDGLTLEQMARAIRSVSLEPYFTDVHETYLFKSTVYAYLKGNIPTLLDISLVDIGQGPDFDAVTGCEKVPSAKIKPGSGGPDMIDGDSMGSHAVTIVGYRLGSDPSPLAGYGTLLTATRMTRVYAHDDQIGPFARMCVDDRGFLSTSWRGDSSDQIGTVWAIPGNILAPLYNKIRIPFSAVHDAILLLDGIVEEVRQAGALPYSSRLEWDVYLITLNDFKEELLDHPSITGEYRESLLVRSMPRFLWRATALSEGQPVVDLLFDATDIEQGALFLFAVEYDELFTTVAHELANDDSVVSEVQGTNAEAILAWFKSDEGDD